MNDEPVHIGNPSFNPHDDGLKEAPIESNGLVEDKSIEVIRSVLSMMLKSVDLAHKTTNMGIYNSFNVGKFRENIKELDCLVVKLFNVKEGC